MDFSTPKMACGVCHGKGGFRKLKNDFLDTNWIDCPYCEGYGFIEDKTTESECIENLSYNRYKNNLLLELQHLGVVEVCTSEYQGKDWYIEIIPFERKPWVNLMKHILKYSYHNEKVKVDPKHSFKYLGDGELSTFWELHITTHEMKDIESLIELIKFYNQSTIGG